MQLDGLKSNGPIRPDKPSQQRKADPKPGGKSFADVLTKAKHSQGNAQASKPAQSSGAQPAGPGPIAKPFSGAASVPSPAHAPAADAAAPHNEAGAQVSPKASGAEAAPSAQEYLETIRFRLKTGYYDNPRVDDALSDKLSGYFDEAAE